MNRNVDAGIVEKLTLSVSKSDQTAARLKQSQAARRDKETKRTLAEMILTATENAKSVEELIHIERTLQALDKGKAVMAQDKTSIKNAERDYAQIVETVEQMRRSPVEYFKANESFKETGGDFKKMPRGRGLQQINGNKARMQNRSAFSDENNRLVWDARSVLAEKTATMLKTLHNNLAKNYERSLKIQEQLELKQE